MASFRKYLGAKFSECGFVFHGCLLWGGISAWAQPILNAEVKPSASCGAVAKLGANFDRKLFWQRLADIDALDLVRLRGGWSPQQKNCFEELISEGSRWVEVYTGTKGAEFWAFRAGVLNYAGKQNAQQLGAVDMVYKAGEGGRVAAGYYKAMALAPTLKAEITQALEEASLADAPEPFDGVLRRRAMKIVKTRLAPEKLFGIAQKWSKLYPKEIEIQLWAFDAAIATKNVKIAQKYLRGFEGVDLSAYHRTPASLKAEILFALGKYREASQIYASLLQDKKIGSARRQHYSARYLEGLLELKQWPQVRSTLEFLLNAEPNNERYLRLYEVSFDQGALDPARALEELQAASERHPDSLVLRSMLARRYLKEFERGPRQDKANLMARAEALSSQLSSAQPTSADALYLQGRVLYLKKAFAKAENVVREAVVQTKAPDATYQTSLPEIYELAGRVLWARGLWGDARLLLREGISRVDLKEQKAPLQKLLREIPN